MVIQLVPQLPNGMFVLMITDRVDLPQYAGRLAKLMAYCMDENRRDFSLPWVSAFMMAADHYYEHTLANQIGLWLAVDQTGHRQVYPAISHRRILLVFIIDPANHNNVVASAEVLVDINSATHSAQLSNLMVPAGYRRQGFGYTLFNAVKSCVRRRWGTRYIQVFTQAGQPAYQLYQRLGFTERATFLVDGRPRSLLEYQYH
ncbi:hypothetical protein PG993_004692 [Apiospora rasikravindrae]|uniref:N-acetyltransferase domain-containing protein n=1 Tax=Apiospora rasikravindrae TaxID=990691 RepID=A0ABR1TDH6_9PEZI